MPKRIGEALIALQSRPPLQLWKLSESGENIVRLLRAKRANAHQQHNELARRLSQWLARSGRVSLLNRQILFSTNDWMPDGVTGFPRMNSAQAIRHRPTIACRSRPDIISINETTERRAQEPWIIEVKTRRADFLADLQRPEKRGAYFFLAEKVFYGVPSGLIEPNEVPDGTGLIVETPTGDIIIAVDTPRRRIRHHAHIRMLFGTGAHSKTNQSTPATLQGDA